MLGLGWAEEVGGMIQPVKLFVVKTVSDGGDPEVVLVGQRKASNVGVLLAYLIIFGADGIWLSVVFGGHCRVPYECADWGGHYWDIA